MRVEVDQPSGFASQVSGVHSGIESGVGYAYGVFARSYTDTPSSSGRAYGVYAIAGNATSGANYGLYARLEGSNGGSGSIWF